MKYIKLYENFDFEEEDFDYEEVQNEYQFYTHNVIEKNRYSKPFYYGKKLEDNNMILFNNFRFKNWSVSENRPVLRVITNDELEYIKDNNNKISIFNNKDNIGKFVPYLPYDMFMEFVENNHDKL